VKSNCCVHYNGALNPVTKGVCRAGVNLRHLVGGKVEGWITRLPCTPTLEIRGGGERAACDKYREPTTEELAAHKRETDEAMKKFMVAFSGNVLEWRKANAWDKKNPKGATGKVPCEACGTGEIHLSMSEYNGHVHGQCTTAGCVSWME
jgi:hypothetical protein